MTKQLQKSAIILMTLMLCGSNALAQMTINWSKTYGGNGADRGHCVQQTTDGGYIVSGYTDTQNNGDVTGYHGGGDVWLVKLDSSGDLVWQNAYGGSGGEPFTQAYTNVLQTLDGGYLVTAESYSSDGDLTLNHGNLDLWVFKTDNQGALLWQKSLGGGIHEGAYTILQEADGGFVLAGYTSSNDGDVLGAHGMADGWIVKLSATGDLLWQKTMGGSWTDSLTSIQHTSDGGYITSGYTLSNDGDIGALNPDWFFGYADFWVAKLNSAAEIEWQAVFGGSGVDEARRIVQTSDGGYVVVGETQSTNGDITESFGERDWWIVKLSATGTMQWQKSMGGSDRDQIKSLTASSDGNGFFIVGSTASTNGHVTDNHGGRDIWFVKLNNAGDVLINQCFGGTGNEDGFFGIEAANGQIVITGRTNTDSNGDIYEDTQGEDLWVFTFQDTTLGSPEVANLELSMYPNPTADILYFSEHLETIEVYSINGQRLIQVANTNQISLNELNSGMYILKAQTMDGNSVSQKIMKK